MKYWKRSIPDPIRGLNLERLAAQIDSFQNGYLADFTLTADAMENRDDILKNVITKRKKSVTRHGWEIMTGDCTAEARAHRAALDFFYRNLRCSHALRPNESGNFQLLLYQMMDAVGKGYAVHEILWKPVLLSSRGRGASAAAMTAEFRFVPLWYFEATTGPLRFLRHPGALAGEPLAERDWLVTVGDALMLACARAFLFKHYPLQSWLDFTEKFGFPGIRGITGATRGTPEFSEMEDALRTFMSELAVVTNTAESIDLIDLKGSGQPPFADLVERMDRVMCSLWRGADLSTLSRDKGYGATLQEQEARILEQDDARHLSEHLNATLDRWVIESLFGSSVKPLARVKILVTPHERTPHDLAIDQFLLLHGARLPLAPTLERYGRVQAKPNEPALERRPGSADPLLPKSAGRLVESASFNHTHSPASFPNSTHTGFMNTKENNIETHPVTSRANSEVLDDYIQISPIGVFDHARGYQNVDQTALENLVRNFRSFFGRLGRRFAGIPFYIGHPDVPGFENLYTDRKAYGWIMDLQLRDGGLYGKTNWSPAGRDLILNRHYKFLSPYWEAIRIGSKDGKGLFAPSVLRSVGLTNEPNLPVMPLANTGPSDEHPNPGCLGALVPIFPNDSLASPDTAQPPSIDSLSQPGETEPPQPAPADPPIPASEQPQPLPETQPKPFTASSASGELTPPAESGPLSTQIAACRQEIARLNQRLIQVVLDNAVVQARILPVERSHWHNALLASFENTAADLAAAPPRLNTRPNTASLPRVPGPDSDAKQKRILNMVNERMRSDHSSYLEAWLAVRSENPSLF